MNKKILILGAKGMLGHALMNVFADMRPIGWGMMDLDITDKERVQEKISTLRPNIIINAAAYTDVDMSESAQDLATKINGNAVGYLAEISKNIGAIFVHYSTDYIFDGETQDGYNEDTKPRPINAYGASKLLGEQELLKKAQNFYLIRTSWLYGKNGKNFVSSILTKAKQEDTLKVINDQFGKPSNAHDVAVQTRMIIDEKKDYGIYHVTNVAEQGGISWYEFAKKALEINKIDTFIVPCSSNEFSRPAKRPHYSLLINTKLPPLRKWQEALKEYLGSI